MDKFENKMSNATMVARSIFNPKVFHILSKQKLNRTIIYLIILSFIVNLFTLILPFSSMIIQNHGIKNILTQVVPEFTYDNGTMNIPNPINTSYGDYSFVADTSKDFLKDEIKSSGLFVGQKRFFYNSGGITKSYDYQTVIPGNNISKDTFINFKLVLIAYIFLTLITLFSHLFIFLLLFIESLLLFVILKVLNAIIFKIKFHHKFRTLFNISAYSLSGATLLKTLLAPFDVTPLPLIFFHWITIVQIILCLVMSVLALIDIKKHKSANNKLKDEIDSSLSDSEKLDIELGFDNNELEIKRQIKEEALKLNEELKKFVSDNKKDTDE